jgi:hypothetical protein
MIINQRLILLSAARGPRPPKSTTAAKRPPEGPWSAAVTEPSTRGGCRRRRTCTDALHFFPYSVLRRRAALPQPATGGAGGREEAGA